MENQRILIVDDNFGNVALLQRVLDAHYDIVPAYNGLDALQAVSEQTFDLVLLDIMMPDISGLDVLETLRKKYNSSQLPVILISALGERDHIVAGLRAGANDYISKPIEPQIVQARVETQLELKTLADERQKLINQLRAANKMRDRLMKMASHDLKNPINTMNMALKIMEVDSCVDDKSIINMAYKSIRQMHNIVMEFLDMDILKDNDVKVQLETVSINATVDDVIETFAFVAQEKQIQLDYHPMAGHIVADTKRLQQVLNNLVSNAIKYSPRGGMVEICVESNGKAVRIHVMDEGAGIPKDEQAQLFQPFAKISTQPTAGEDSTGLGLWIAQQMMEVQNGKIGLFSAEGKGCDFWVELPLAKVEVEEDDEDETIPTRAAFLALG